MGGQDGRRDECAAFSKVATSVVYDALAQSKSSLLPEKAVNERRAKWMASDGGLDEGAFMSGMTKSRIAVCVGFFLLGKVPIYVLVGRVVLDATGLFDKAREIAGPFTEPIFWVLTLGAVYLTYQQSAEIARSTAIFETLSREEALEKEKTTDRERDRLREAQQGDLQGGVSREVCGVRAGVGKEQALTVS